MSRTAAQWQSILEQCGCPESRSATWAPIFSAVIQNTTFSAGEHELPDFLGQILHESGQLGRLIENLSYVHADRIMAVWPSRFTSIEAAKPYANNPEALAELVYGGRMGNMSPGDGWKYRGRGLLQVTGKKNYEAVGKALGIDLIAIPGQLASPETALRASIAWWERNISDEAMGDIRRITRAVNGGSAGLEDRDIITSKAMEALAA